MKIPFVKNFRVNKRKTMAFIASALEKIGVGSVLVALFPFNVGFWLMLYALCLATISFVVEFVLVNIDEE